MSEPIYSEKWISGRRGCAACLSVTEWPDLIHLSGEADHLTYGMVERWARKNYPDQTIQPASFGEGYVGVRIIKDQALLTPQREE